MSKLVFAGLLTLLFMWPIPFVAVAGNSGRDGNKGTQGATLVVDADLVTMNPDQPQLIHVQYTRPGQIERMAKLRAYPRFRSTIETILQAAKRSGLFSRCIVSGVKGHSARRPPAGKGSLFVGYVQTVKKEKEYYAIHASMYSDLCCPGGLRVSG